MSRITKQGYKFEITKIIQGLTQYTEIDEIMNRLSELEDVEESRSKGCDFCCYTEYPDNTLYPKRDYSFYAGYSKQIKVDDFDEKEIEEINYCPMCGKPLKDGAK